MAEGPIDLSDAFATTRVIAGGVVASSVVESRVVENSLIKSNAVHSSVVETSIGAGRLLGDVFMSELPSDPESFSATDSELTENASDSAVTNPSWQRVQLARHPKRPHALDYIQRLFTGFHELHGDRNFGDDKSVIGGFGLFEGQHVMVIGQEKGRTTKEKLLRNFGMPKPEGYRKAIRLMQLAAKFNRPIISLIDTPGAYPGIDAEERGQAEAIAYCLREMSRLPVPIIAVVIGEGGSGGALGIAVANRVYILENAWYSVITPESCAAIIWRDSLKAPLAAEALKLTAQDLLDNGLVDGLVAEPEGGAQLDYDTAARSLQDTLRSALVSLAALTKSELLEQRYQKFRTMGNTFIDRGPDRAAGAGELADSSIRDGTSE